MDFMFLSNSEQKIIGFDVRSEIVSKDKFFDRAQIYISTDKETLLHRQALFSDILKINGLSDFLISLSEKLIEYSPLIKSTQALSNEERLHNILYLNVYIEFVGFVYKYLSSIKDSITSTSLKRLYELAKNDFERDEYKRLKRYYEKNAERLRSINSVTVGINLDALYRPKEAGIVSFNKERFKSGDLLDRILKLDFENNEFYCTAPLTVIDKKLGFEESQRVNYSVLKAMGKVFDSGLHHLSNRCIHYIKEKLAEYFEYFESLNFVVEAVHRIRIFKEKNIPLCFPQISADRSFSFVSLYNSELCRIKNKKDIVPSTARLESNVHCYILTGVNSGGKTIFIDSLAAAQYYFQLGMPVPAKEASLPICDAIFKISVEEQASVNLVGRFEKECISLSAVLKKTTKNSLVLIDEVFTSTSAAEAVPIAASFISEFCKVGGKCVFVTHHHELCEGQEIIDGCGEKIGYLHTETQEEKRLYAIQNGKSSPYSQAQSIAKKYGLIQ